MIPISSALHPPDSSPTSLVPLESTVAPETAPPLTEVPDYFPHLSETWLHSHWADRRRKVHLALIDAGASSKRLAHFSACAANFWILKSNTESRVYKLVRDFCHDRFCELCARARAAVIFENLERHLPDSPIRFLTLTLSADDQPLRPRIDRLLASFRRLRASAFWRDRVTGGIAFLEVTVSLVDNHWHPHLHVLVFGSYIPKPDLKQAWLRVTGDSHIVSISLVRDPSHVHHYVAKYVTKPAGPALARHPALLAELVRALTGRKLLHAFGIAARWHLLRPVTDGDWRLYAHASHSRFFRTVSGTLDATLAALIAHVSPLVVSITVECPDPSDDPDPPPDPPRVKIICEETLPLWPPDAS